MNRQEKEAQRTTTEEASADHLSFLLQAAFASVAACHICNNKTKLPMPILLCLKALLQNLGSQGRIFIFLRPRILKKVRRELTWNNRTRSHCPRIQAEQNVTAGTPSIIPRNPRAKGTGFHYLVAGDLSARDQELSSGSSKLNVFFILPRIVPALERTF